MSNLLMLVSVVGLLWGLIQDHERTAYFCGGIVLTLGLTGRLFAAVQ